MIELGKLEAYIGFIRLLNFLFKIVIGRPTLNRFVGVSAFKAKKACFGGCGTTKLLPMVLKYHQKREVSHNANNEDLTSEFKEADSSSDEDANRITDLVFSNKT